MAGKFSIVPTPIGNRGDMTLRAIDVLREADSVCAEDTRVTGALLSHFDIHTTLQRCDENVIAQRTPALIERMSAGEHIAFCSDAGMPGVSDPGIRLVDAALEAGIEVEVLPGPSAVTCALVASGFNASAFYFGGFLPRKQAARKTALGKLASLDAALIFYESPHRIAASSADIADVFPSRRVALCRELTKLHEEVVRLPAVELATVLGTRATLKGECAIVIEPPQRQEAVTDLDDPALRERVKQALEEGGMSKSELARTLAAELGVSKNDLYELIHGL